MLRGRGDQMRLATRVPPVPQFIQPASRYERPALLQSYQSEGENGTDVD